MHATPLPHFLKSDIRHPSLITALALAWTAAVASTCMAAESPPPRQKINFNADWRFLRADAPGAEKPEFDASAWTTVSCPHTWNDVDSFDNFATGGH